MFTRQVESSMIRLTGIRLYGLSTSALKDFPPDLRGTETALNPPSPVIFTKERLEYFLAVILVSFVSKVIRGCGLVNYFGLKSYTALPGLKNIDNPYTYLIGLHLIFPLDILHFNFYSLNLKRSSYSVNY